jgi:uncharacterized membrane protein
MTKHSMLPRLALAGILAATLASAQRGGPGGRGGDLPQVTMGQSTPLERISTGFALNKDQKKDLRSTLDDAQKEAAPIRDRMVKAHIAIGEAIQAGKSQQEIDQAVNAYAALDAQMTAIEMRAFSTIYKSLDKDQQAKARPLFLSMQGMFKGKNWNEPGQP